MDKVNSQELILLRLHWEQMRTWVSSATPEEACGLIAGINRTSSRIYPVENELHSPVRFRLHPQKQLDAFIDIESRGLDFLAIYHSHPKGPGFPSQTDLAEFAYPEVLSLIWYPEQGSWQCRCYEIKDLMYIEINIRKIP